MCDHRIGCILVTDDQGYLVGIVTDRDLACVALARQNSTELPLSTAMTRNPLSVEQTSDLEQVVLLMEESGVRRIPVIARTAEGKRRCVGLITLDDLIVSKLIDYDHLSRIVRSQIERRSDLRVHASVEHPKHRTTKKRRQPSLNQFYQLIQNRTGLLDEPLIWASQAILSAVVQSLHYTAAIQLISFLPETLQAQLLELPAGPIKEVTLTQLKTRLSSHPGISARNLDKLLKGFFECLSEVVPKEEVEYLRYHLPQDFALLLPFLSSPRKADVA